MWARVVKLFLILVVMALASSFLWMFAADSGEAGQAPQTGPQQPRQARQRPVQPAETSIPDKVRLFIPYKEYSQEDNKRILDMYQDLRVSDVSDGMDVVGLQDIGIVSQDIHALWKDTQQFTHRGVGIAVTARYVPSNKREPKLDDKTVSLWYGTITTEAFQQVLFPGSVLVIDAMEDGESRSIGSTNIRNWQKAGMV